MPIRIRSNAFFRAATEARTQMQVSCSDLCETSILSTVSNLAKGQIDEHCPSTLSCQSCRLTRRSRSNPVYINPQYKGNGINAGVK